MNKIYIIGDSFCSTGTPFKPRENEKEFFWGIEFYKNLNTHELSCDGWPSRDAQTIIDNWIKIIPIIDETDYLIICLPTFNRTRLPLSSNYYEIAYIDDTNNSKSKLYTNRFAGTRSYNDQSLEIWDKNYNREYFIDKLTTQEVINSSEANEQNYIEVVESLYKITNCNKYVFSWANLKFKSDIIEDNIYLEEKLGKLETHDDVYIETNGKCGQKHDGHWSYKTQKNFCAYVCDKFNIKFNDTNI